MGLIPKTSHEGYTLVEVIVVMVIIVIISAFAISKTSDLSAGLVTQTEVLKTHLRYAQTLAMSGSGSDVFGIKCSAGYYWLFSGINPDSNIAVLSDDEKYDTHNDNKQDLSLKKIDVTVFTVFFDARGIPYNAYTDETNNTPLSSDLSITLTPDGEASPVESITITQLTGFIP